MMKCALALCSALSHWQSSLVLSCAHSHLSTRASSSCANRTTSQLYLTSSNPWYKHIKMGGIFDSDAQRNPWAGSNMVYAAYCSSDAWHVPAVSLCGIERCG